MMVDIMGPHFFASDRFTKGRTGTAWKTGKILWLPIWFPYGRFRSGFCRLLPKGCKIFVLIFDCEIPRAFGEIKMYTFGISYFNGRGWEFWNETGSAGHFRLGIIL